MRTFQVRVARRSQQNFFSEQSSFPAVFAIDGAQYLRNGSEAVQLPLRAGERVRFEIDAPGHFFFLSEKQSLGGAFNTLTTEALPWRRLQMRMDAKKQNIVSSNGRVAISKGTIEITVPEDLSFLFYNCAVPGHTGMGGKLSIGSSVAGETKISKDLPFLRPLTTTGGRNVFVPFTQINVSQDATRLLTLLVKTEEFVRYGRSETMTFQAGPNGNDFNISLLLSPDFEKKIVDVSLASTKTVPANVQLDSSQTSKADQKSSRYGSVTLNFVYPFLEMPTPQNVLDEWSALDARIATFFTVGQAFQPPRYISDFIFDESSKSMQLVRNVVAPKSQYLRRVCFAYMLFAISPNAQAASTQARVCGQRVQLSIRAFCQHAQWCHGTDSDERG